jgi:hypothetical protein
MTYGSIGERAARAIKARAPRGKLTDELKRLGINTWVFYDWKNDRSDPSAYNLQSLALAGYDVIYILTGKENSHVDD